MGKSRALKEIDWRFNSDHEGEMNLGEQFLTAGYFGAQVGNKIDTAYDALDNQGHGDGDHVSSLMEKLFRNNLKEKFTQKDKDDLNDTLISNLMIRDDSMVIRSLHAHIGERKIISQLQPFNGLVFDKSIQIATSHIESCPFGVNILRKYL